MSAAVRTEGLVKRYNGTLAVAGVDLLPETVMWLCDIPEVVALKEATGSMARTVDLVEKCGDRDAGVEVGLEQVVERREGQTGLDFRGSRDEDSISALPGRGDGVQRRARSQCGSRRGRPQARARRASCRAHRVDRSLRSRRGVLSLGICDRGGRRSARLHVRDAGGGDEHSEGHGLTSLRGRERSGVPRGPRTPCW